MLCLFYAGDFLGLIKMFISTFLVSHNPSIGRVKKDNLKGLTPQAVIFVCK